MTSYHYTDDLGQAAISVRKALAEAADQFDEMEAQLKAEREMHRDRETRMLERAEAAELEVSSLEETVGELGDRADRADDLETEVSDLEAKLEAAEQALAAEREVTRRQFLRIEELQSQLAGERNASWLRHVEG